MEDTKFLNLDELWNAILSRQPTEVISAFESLSEDQQRAVYTHLQRMSEEPGWQLEQRASARAALIVLQDRKG